MPWGYGIKLPTANIMLCEECYAMLKQTNESYLFPKISQSVNNEQLI